MQSNYPAVILLSRIDEWWSYIDDCDQHSIVSALEEIHAGLPILTIASCRADVPTRVRRTFWNRGIKRHFFVGIITYNLAPSFSFKNLYTIMKSVFGLILKVFS